VTVRRDGAQRKPVTIWVVRDGDGLYVRSGYGDRAAWYRGTQARREGHIMAGGIEKDVRFEDVAYPVLNDRIDTAFRSKYLHHGAQWVDPMVAGEARASTIKLVPRLPTEICSVIPKAGTHGSTNRATAKWVPAFAGTDGFVMS
jgi:hypothetical protein